MASELPFPASNPDAGRLGTRDHKFDPKYYDSELTGVKKSFPGDIKIGK